ncbi:MAG: 4-hydroxy-tetrahydrodipicolinate synthase [Bacteroidales bacterium]|nr:4-hydroxy-tetrahydrodipicolinate synthase [Bacteroidales bacterium]
MKYNTKLDGTGVAIVTPFHNYGTIDFGSLEKLVDFIIEGGVDFIVALGTTSEAATMTEDEKIAVMDVVMETVNGRVPVVMGMGGNSTQAIVSKIKKTNFDGIDAILSVAPYYNKPNQRGLYGHFKAIAASSPIPIILYNVPSRTASNISAETTLSLAQEFDNIIAIKEASGNFTQIMDILRDKPEDFKVFSGDDAITFPMMTLGATGVISVVANAYPRPFSDMVRYIKSGDYEKALKIHYSLTPIIHQMFADGNPAGVKVALEAMGLLKNNLRLPLVKANKSVNLALSALVAEYKYPSE